MNTDDAQEQKLVFIDDVIANAVGAVGNDNTDLEQQEVRNRLAAEVVLPEVIVLADEGDGYVEDC